MDLTDEQRVVLEPLLPEPPKRADGRGKPWRDAREVLNGVLWVLRTGAPWRDLPKRYPPYQTCHRRFQRWVCETAHSNTCSRLSLKTSGSREAWTSRSASSTVRSW